MKDGVQPKFCKARPMSYALQESVEAEYNRLETEGIVDLEKVEFGEWATPMVHVPIAGGSTHQPPTQCPTVSNPIAWSTMMCSWTYEVENSSPNLIWRMPINN